MLEVHDMTAFITAKAVFFATAFLGGWIWVMRQVEPLSREWDAVLPMWPAWIGPAVTAVGAAGTMICIGIFVVRGRGTPAIFDAPTQFVAIGPYRYVRNPMYWSAATLFAGLALSTSSLAALAFVPAWWLLIHAFVVLIEEPGLHRRFGDTYAEYCDQVPRWIPRLPAEYSASAFREPTRDAAPLRDRRGPRALQAGSRPAARPQSRSLQ